MNIIALIKQTFDTEAKIILDPNGKIDASAVNLILNPYDEFAVEEAVQLKEKYGGEVTVITFGGAKAPEALRYAMAMGADKALHIDDAALADADEWGVAQVLSKAVSTLSYDLILAGRIAVDDGSSQVAVRVAEALNLPVVSTVTKLTVDSRQATALREIDGGTETVELELPAVITVQKGINEPRFPSIPSIMKAKKKELKTAAPQDFGVEAEQTASKMKLIEYTLPAPRQAGRILSGNPSAVAGELAKILSLEEKIL
jgi:electron transfer flavoprotein beta subunit